MLLRLIKQLSKILTILDYVVVAVAFVGTRTEQISPLLLAECLKIFDLVFCHGQININTCYKNSIGKQKTPGFLGPEARDAQTMRWGHSGIILATNYIKCKLNFVERHAINIAK